MAKSEISKMRNETVKKIRDFHIIRKILKDMTAEQKRDPKIAGLVAAYDAYVKFFGGIRIDQWEDFDRLFSRLEKVYIAGDESKKVQPEAEGYTHYIKNVLGDSVLDKFGEILDQPENKERMADFYLEVGRKQESTALVVARAVRDYAKLSNVMMNYHESVAAGHKKDEQIEKLRVLLKYSKDKALTIDQIIEEVGKMESRLIAKIIENTPKSNDDLIKGIAILTGRKVNEIKALMEAGDGKILAAIGEIKAPISGMVVDLGTVKTDVAHIKGKVDVMASDIEEIKKNTSRYSAGKTAMIATIGALGITALYGVGGIIYNTVTPDKMTESALLADYMNLVNVINGLQTDGITDAEKQQFIDENLKAFLDKYKGTNLEEKSKECADALTANINGTMTIGNQSTLVSGYFQDTAALDSTLNGLISSDGKLTDAERTAFIGSDQDAPSAVTLHNFLAKYAGTALESASKSDAEGFKAYANAAYDLGVGNNLSAGYSADVVELADQLDGLIASDSTFTADENTTFKASVDAFATKYAGTAFETASGNQAVEFKALADTAYTLSQAGIDVSTLNTTLTGYNEAVKDINVTLSNLINDADGLTQAEYDTFFGVGGNVETFRNAYASTPLKNASESQIESLTSIANAVLGLQNPSGAIGVENALLSSYHQDVQTLNTTLGGMILSDGVLTEEEKTEFAESYVTPFLDEYAGTALESASVNQANGFKSIANSVHLMGVTQQLMETYNVDLAALDSALYGYLTDYTYAESEKTEFEGLVQAFADKYASTSLSTRSGLDAEVMKTLSNNIYGMSELKQQAIGELATEKETVLDLNSQIATLKGENSALESTNKEYAEKIKSLENTVKALNDKIDELILQIGNASTDSQVQALLTQIDDLKKQVSELEGQVSTLTAENSTLKTENAELKAQISDLKTENANIKADLEGANATVDSLNQVVDILKSEKAALEEDLKNNYITKDEYNAKVAEFDALEAELRTEIEELTSQIASIAQTLELEKAEYNAIIEKINELKLQAAESAELNNQLAEAKAQIEALEQELAGSSAEATALVFDIYEYITGTTTNDISTAMKVISEQLGITSVPPSQDAESNVKQPS